MTWWPSSMTYLFVNVTYWNCWAIPYVDQVWWWYVKAFMSYAWQNGQTDKRIHLSKNLASNNSSGALAFNQRKNWKSWNFQKSYLDVHLTPWCKVPQNPSGYFFIQDGHHCCWLPIVKLLNHVNILIFDTITELWYEYPWFEINETQWNHYSNIDLNPAVEYSIRLPLQSKYHEWHENVTQQVN